MITADEFLKMKIADGDDVVILASGRAGVSLHCHAGVSKGQIEYAMVEMFHTLLKNADTATPKRPWSIIRDPALDKKGGWL